MRRYNRTTYLTIGCLSVLSGIGATRLISVSHDYIWLAASLSAVFMFRRNALLLSISLGMTIGLWRGDIYLQKFQALQKLDGQKISLIVKVTQDAIYGTNQQLDFTANSARLQSGKVLAGNLKISGFGPAMVYRGDTVKVSGKLYPASGTYQARVSYAQLERLSDDRGVINNFTRRLSSGMQNALPEPNASFGLGLLIGQRNNLPTDLYQKLIMVGLVHIVAVSGYNLTILVRAAGRLKLFSKYQQLILSLALIVVFLMMTGFSASIVRAAIVSALSLWAWFYGRKVPAMLILAFTAALTGLINPFYVWGDLGWYLSFLAFFGILIISPILSARFFKRQPKLLAATALETFCAELMALPFIMLMFGQLSLIGLIANVLVVPLIPLAMLLSAVAAFVGSLAPSIAGWVAWPANWLLTYILDLIRWFASLPGIFQKRTIGLALMLGFYAVLGAILLIIRRHKSGKAPVAS